MFMIVKLIQGIHFDAYENTERKGAHGRDVEFLCNVKAETFDMVKADQDVEIDFDGDEAVIWNAVITKKDKKNSRLYYYLP